MYYGSAHEKFGVWTGPKTQIRVTVFSCFQRWFTALLLMWISTSFRWPPMSRLYTSRVYLHYTLDISICETVGHWSVTGVRHFLCLLLHLASVRMPVMYFFIYRCSMNTLLHFDKNFAFLSQFVFMSTEYYQNVAFEEPWLGSVCPVTALWLKIDGVKFSLKILYLQGKRAEQPITCSLCKDSNR